MPPAAPEEEGMHQPVAFIGIGSKNEQEMQQLIIEDKVRNLYFVMLTLHLRKNKIIKLRDVYMTFRTGLGDEWDTADWM